MKLMLSKEEIQVLEKEPRKNFGLLVQIAEPKLRKILHEQCKDVSFFNDIEDILQETYLSALQDIDSYGPEKGKFVTWIARIACRRLVDFWRAKSGRPDRPNTYLNVTKPIAIESFGDILVEKPKEVFHYDEREILQTAYSRLPDRLKNISQMHHGKGISQSKTAKQFKMTKGTVGTMVYDMYKVLRGQFEIVCKENTRKAALNDSNELQQNPYILRAELKDSHGKNMHKPRDNGCKIHHRGVSRRRTAC